MRKNRNTFFNEAAMNYSGYTPNINMPANAPFQASTAYNSFYSGPNPNQNIPSMTNYAPSDLESRLAKMERQINRLEHRLSKLESNNTFTSEDFDSTTNNMYML